MKYVKCNVKLLNEINLFTTTLVSAVNMISCLTEIKDNLFLNCGSLKNIKLPNKLTKIKSGSFANCKSLENIEIPASVIEIENSAFANC